MTLPPLLPTASASAPLANVTSALDKTTRRRLAKQVKKAKAAQMKMEAKKVREDKREFFKTQRREQRLERIDKAAPGACWTCGRTDHRKQDCPNKEMEHGNKICFHCRRRGHSINDCPRLNDASSLLSEKDSSPVCFNCGSSEHILRNCRKKKMGNGSTYATCFVCRKQGHLSSHCPQSTLGIYPKGGSCKICSSKMHLARDCPGEESSNPQDNIHSQVCDLEPDSKHKKQEGLTSMSKKRKISDEPEEEQDRTTMIQAAPKGTQHYIRGDDLTEQYTATDTLAPVVLAKTKIVNKHPKVVKF